MNRTAMRAEIAAVVGFQLALAALLKRATDRATALETDAAHPVHPSAPAAAADRHTP